MELTKELLLSAYSQGIFPMAESAYTKDVYWVDPEKRGVLPLNRFHIPKKLIKKIHKQNVNAKIDLGPCNLVNDLDLKPPLDGEWY